MPLTKSTFTIVPTDRMDGEVQLFTVLEIEDRLVVSTYRDLSPSRVLSLLDAHLYGELSHSTQPPYPISSGKNSCGNS